MDWSRVSLRELLESLQEADLGHPKSPAEFLQRFSVPRDTGKLAARWKANVYYFRANYLLICGLGYGLCLLSNPVALLGLVLATLAVLCTNDGFATCLNDKLLRLVRRIHPPTALKIKARTVHSGAGPMSSMPGHRRRSHHVYVLTLPRFAFVLLCLALAGFILRASRAWRTLAWGTLLGMGLPVLHASFRSPNLKVKLYNAKDEFKAAWREYQAGLGVGPGGMGMGMNGGGYSSTYGAYQDYTR